MVWRPVGIGTYHKGKDQQEGEWDGRLLVCRGLWVLEWASLKRMRGKKEKKGIKIKSLRDQAVEKRQYLDPATGVLWFGAFSCCPGMKHQRWTRAWFVLGVRIGEVERTGESGQQGWQKNWMKQWLLLHGSQNCCCPLYLSLCPSSGGKGSLALQVQHSVLAVFLLPSVCCPVQFACFIPV